MKENPQKQRVRSNPVLIDNCYRELLRSTYRMDEVCVYFEKPLTDEERRIKMEPFRPYAKEPITYRVCKNCDPSLGLWSVEIWKAKGIHTAISGPVIGGVNPVTGTVGEQYSLNFLNSPPFEADKDGREYKECSEEQVCKRNKVLVAVLDTGIDTGLVCKDYLWKDTSRGNGCYPLEEGASGWNFLVTEDDPNTPVYGSPNIFDDNPSKHGSIISQYIINEFAASKDNSLELMTLKTHDKNGQGDLFGIICAMHYAIAKGANIINASWGFYFYEPVPVPYLQKLITEILKERGILFVTAAGNANCLDDQIANAIYFNQNKKLLTPEELRNLEIHNFYPAVLGRNNNNVVTVTTTDGKSVSTTQNYSETFVDLGIEADKVTLGGMKFRQPFGGNNAPDELVSGSSFATAIATGRIGAFCDPKVPFDKATILLEFENGSNNKPKLIRNSDPLRPELIKRGRFMEKPHKP